MSYKKHAYQNKGKTLVDKEVEGSDKKAAAWAMENCGKHRMFEDGGKFLDDKEEKKK